MKIVSVIPIKMNNERLPGKNTRVLGKHPLIYYTQKMLLEIEDIQERYVFCSNRKIEDYLLPGVTYLQRSERLDLPTSNFNQIFESFADTVVADIYVYAHATAPFIKAETTRECIRAVLTDNYDSAFCAVRIQDFLWSNGEPLNFDPKDLPRSQDLRPIYRETSGTYVFTRETFKNYHRRIGKQPFIKEVDFKEAVDINTADDFRLAEKLLNL